MRAAAETANCAQPPEFNAQPVKAGHLLDRETVTREPRLNTGCCLGRISRKQSVIIGSRSPRCHLLFFFSLFASFFSWGVLAGFFLVSFFTSLVFIGARGWVLNAKSAGCAVISRIGLRCVQAQESQSPLAVRHEITKLRLASITPRVFSKRPLLTSNEGRIEETRAGLSAADIQPAIILSESFSE